MTPDEVMAEIAKHGSVGVCSCRYGGEWWLHNEIVAYDTARHYIIGFLHEWSVKLPPDVGTIDIACADEYLSALWRAYLVYYHP